MDLANQIKQTESAPLESPVPAPRERRQPEEEIGDRFETVLQEEERVEKPREPEAAPQAPPVVQQESAKGQPGTPVQDAPSTTSGREQGSIVTGKAGATPTGTTVVSGPGVTALTTAQTEAGPTPTTAQPAVVATAEELVARISGQATATVEAKPSSTGTTATPPTTQTATDSSPTVLATAARTSTTGKGEPAPVLPQTAQSANAALPSDATLAAAREAVPTVQPITTTGAGDGTTTSGRAATETLATTQAASSSPAAARTNDQRAERTAPLTAARTSTSETLVQNAQSAAATPEVQGTAATRPVDATGDLRPLAQLGENQAQRPLAPVADLAPRMGLDEAVAASKTTTRGEAARPAAPTAQSIADQVRLHLEPRRPEVTVQLEPRQLGRMVIRLSMRAGELTARITTSVAETARLLDADAPLLFRTLADAGLKVANVEVRHGQVGEEQRDPGQSPTDQDATSGTDQGATAQSSDDQLDGNASTRADSSSDSHSLATSDDAGDEQTSTSRLLRSGVVDMTI